MNLWFVPTAARVKWKSEWRRRPVRAQASTAANFRLGPILSASASLLCLHCGTLVLTPSPHPPFLSVRPPLSSLQPQKMPSSERASRGRAEDAQAFSSVRHPHSCASSFLPSFYLSFSLRTTERRKALTQKLIIMSAVWPTRRGGGGVPLRFRENRFLFPPSFPPIPMNPPGTFGIFCSSR